MLAVRPHRLASAAGALAVAVVVAACGGSSKSTSTAQTNLAATSTTSSTTSTSTTTHAKSKSTKAKSQKTTTTSSSTSHTTRHTTTTSTTRTTSATTTHTTSTPAYAKPIHAKLVGDNHHPTVNKPWFYTVTVTDANGRPLSGTLDTEFAFNGVVVGHDTPPTHKFTNGHFREKLTYPPAVVGHPIDLQVVVHTVLGSVTLDWPVQAKK